MANNKAKIWVDLVNPSNVHYFNSIINDLRDYEIFFTIRDRAETVDFAKSLGIDGMVVGTDYTSSFKKSANIIIRTLDLAFKVPKFDVAMSFENSMSVSISKIRAKKSILYCDNDLKIYQRKNTIQDLENKIKSLSTNIVVPFVCYENFKKIFDEDKLIPFSGYKEDVYIANYVPNDKFLDKLPFEEFVVVRPEAFGSFYVKEHKSITSELIKRLTNNDINVIYLPRDKEDIKYADGHNVFIPKETLNGLDLCYFANAVMTGSGTFAREAACMGNTSVSFFPSDKLLSVDKKLIDEGKMFHSKDPKDIVDYVIRGYGKGIKLNLERSKNVKKEIVDITRSILEDI